MGGVAVRIFSNFDDRPFVEAVEAMGPIRHGALILVPYPN